MLSFYKPKGVSYVSEPGQPPHLIRCGGKHLLPIIAVFLLSPSSPAYSANSSSTAEGVIINEILPSPEGPDDKEEWIELFNQNDFGVDLSYWRLGDAKGKVKNYTFPNKSVVLPKSFLVLSRQKTKITLNNDGDGLTLAKPDGKISDAVNYEKTSRGKSYNRKGVEWIWSEVLTPGAANVFPQKEVNPKRGAWKTEGVRNEAGLAAINGPVLKQNYFEPSLIALTLAFSSAAIILLLKRKLTTQRG